MNLAAPMIREERKPKRRWRAARIVAEFLVSMIALRFVLIGGLRTFGVYAALLDYRAGVAQIHGFGLMGGQPPVDRETRLRFRGGGCIVDWVYEEIFQTYNPTTRWLVHRYGFQLGSYTGPYPTWREAKAALDGAPALAVDALSEGRVDIGGRHIQLVGDPKDSAHYLLNTWVRRSGYPRRVGADEPDSYRITRATARLIEGRALVLRVSFADHEETDLIDADTGKLLAEEADYHKQWDGGAADDDAKTTKATKASQKKKQPTKPASDGAHRKRVKRRFPG